MNTMNIFLFVSCIFFTIGSGYSQQKLSIEDSIKYVRDLEISQRLYRPHFDSQDISDTELIFKRIDSINQLDLKIVNDFNRFISKEDMTYGIIYKMCDSIINLYPREIILKTILANEHIEKIDENALRGHLSNDFIADYPIRVFILKRSQLFVQYLIKNKYLKTEIPDKLLPIIYKLFQNVISGEGDFDSRYFYGDHDVFSTVNMNKLNTFYNEKVKIK